MRFVRHIAVLVSILLLASFNLLAQGTTGTLTGTVTTAGNPLPGATVTISSPNLQGSRTAETDVNGIYNFGGLPPGDYTVRIELSGMQTVTRTVHVSPAQNVHADADLQLSSLTEAITVTASAPAVLETSEIQTSIKSDLVDNLPMGRGIPATVNLAPGVTTNGPGGGVEISGAQSFDSVWYVNGSVVNEVLRGQPLSTYIEDAIQETTVLTGGISAEYGRFTGGVVSAVTKSGGNEFSGSLRDTFTNPSWTGTTPFGEAKAESDLQHTFEGTFGGRIIRDRLWFFAAGRYQDRTTHNTFFQSSPPSTFDSATKEDRLEGKLTAQITARHSVFGSYVGVNRDISNAGFLNTYEPSALDDRARKETSRSLHYNGIITNQFLIEANYADSKIKFVGDGGPRGDFVHGTNVYDATNDAFLGAPTFGASEFGANNFRSSNDWLLKGTYYLSTKGLGTHNIVAGYDRFTDILHENNAQSGSDFTVYTYADVEHATNGQVQPILETGNALIIWWPILSGTRGTDFKTTSFFVNDKWDVNSKLALSLGARYDKNDAVNSMGGTVAKDSIVTPRLGLSYDTFGNGRLRLNASYSKYAAKIANGNVGDATSSSGAPSILYWLYYGPTVSGLSTVDALQQMFNWFQSTGGTNNRNFFDGETGFLLGGGTNGIATQIRGNLKSPNVQEYAVGVGSQIGRTGFLRVDYQDRKWSDFYANEVTLNTGTVFDPLAQATLDQGLITNSNDLSRKYQAFIVQGGFRPWSRLSIGGNYTWAKIRGNVVGETSGSGPVPNTGPTYYPELLAYPNRNPVGFLPDDQRHKLRAWVSYDQPTRVGSFNFSVLERFDSGTPYSAIGTINPINSSGWACPSCIGGAQGPALPAYLTFPNSGYNYYFSERGALRWDDLSATDVAVNWNLPVSRVGLFVQAELRNALDNHAQILGNTTVLTARTSACRQTTGGARCAAFNPFTATPVEGVNYQLGTNFGKGTDSTHYQTPRTYLFSAGVRF